VSIGIRSRRRSADTAECSLCFGCRPVAPKCAVGWRPEHLHVVFNRTQFSRTKELAVRFRPASRRGAELSFVRLPRQLFFFVFFQEALDTFDRTSRPLLQQPSPRVSARPRENQTPRTSHRLSRDIRFVSHPSLHRLFSVSTGSEHFIFAPEKNSYSDKGTVAERLFAASTPR
jgi:hypothetical protein